MPEVCSYKFDPSKWNENHTIDSSVEDVWRCPHEAYERENYCPFHLSEEKRRDLGLFTDEIKKILLTKISEGDKREKEFIGTFLNELDLQREDLESETEAPIDLRHSEIRGNVDLSDAWIEPRLLLNHSSFRKFTAPGAIFEGGASFRGSKFESHTSFSNAEFDKGTDFSHSEFGNTTIFYGADFSSYSNFAQCRFNNRAKLTRIEFGNDTSFLGSVFGSQSDFRYCIFEGDADFRHASFVKNVNFHEAIFNGYTNFSDAVFNGWGIFHEAVFNDITDFNRVEFKSDANFIRSEFESDPDFISAEFQGDTNLMISPKEDRSYVDMTDSVIRKGVIKQSPDGPSYYDLTRAKVGDVKLRTVYPTSEDTDKGREGEEAHNLFDYFLFCETDFEEFDFSEYEEELADNKWVIHRLAIGEGEISPDKLRETYRKAKEAAREGGNKKAASEFSRLEKKYRKQARRAERGSLSKWLSDLF
ncbi:MAG: pentapeptide repeat-containing protein [Halobacteria archaeon]|nr:pentapeptide repeat-containing protein [Halobacteria archaeon]